jgi:hypothetical protein
MPRRHPRSLKILLPPATRAGLTIAARARDLPLEHLATILLTVIAAINAALDAAAVAWRA